MGRPKIALELTVTDKVFETLGWLLLISIWLLTLYNYPNLPNVIPVHFNGSGQVDGYGDKMTIFSLPLVATFLYVGLTVLNKFPHTFNYQVTITPDNAIQQYTNATQLIRYLKVVMVGIFGLIDVRTIQMVYRKENEIGTWFLPLVLGLIFVPILYFIFQSFQKK